MKKQAVSNTSTCLVCQRKPKQNRTKQSICTNLPSQASKCTAHNNMHTNIFKGFLTSCKTSKSLQFKTAAHQVRMCGAVKIFPHEALKVMESQDLQLHVHQKHWKENQALHRLAQRGNASMLTCQRKSKKKRLMNAPKLSLKDRRAIHTLPQ